MSRESPSNQAAGGAGPSAAGGAVPLDTPLVPSARVVPECHGDVCITCSDEAVPVTVVRLLGDDLALVDTGATREEVSVALVDAGVGDTVLVHAKEAIARVDDATDEEDGGRSGGGVP